MISLLILEESEADRRSLVAAVQAAAADRPVGEAADLGAAERALAEAGDRSIVLCAPAFVEAIAAVAPAAVIVVTAGATSLDAALASLAGGALDVLPLPASAGEVSALLARAHELAGAEATLAEGHKELAARRADLSLDIAGLAQQVAAQPCTDRLRAELSAAVVAELAVCLAPIPARLERAVAEVGDTPAGSAIVDGLHAAVAAVRMISDLHDTVRSEHVPLPIWRQPLASSAFVEAVIKSVDRVASDYEASIDLVRSGGALDFSADPALLRRALENMLECGLRRSRKGRLRFEVSAAEQAIRFDVIDVGGAVPERLLPALFTRLARLEGGTIQRGAALGFCRAVAVALGGSVYASTDGGGLRLTLELPRLAA